MCKIYIWANIVYYDCFVHRYVSIEHQTYDSEAPGSNPDYFFHAEG